jgi:hypothetical protein
VEIDMLVLEVDWDMLECWDIMQDIGHTKD